MRVIVAGCAAEAPRREVHYPLTAAPAAPVAPAAPSAGPPGIIADLDAIAARPAPVNSDATAAALLRSAASLPAGADLVTSLAAIDLTRLSPADRITYLTAMQRAHNWLTGVFHVAVAAAAGPQPTAAVRPSPDPYSPTGNMDADIVCAEVGAALNFTPTATAGLINRGRAAVGALRSINAELLAGNWGETHLRRAVDACADTDSDIAATAATNVTGRLRSAPRCTPAVLRKRLQREIAALAPEQTITRIKAKRRDRSAELHHENDLRGRLEIDAPWSALNWTFSELSVWAEQRLAKLRQLRRAYPEVPLCCTEAVNAAVELFPFDHWDDDTHANTQTKSGGAPEAGDGEAYGNRYDHSGETSVDGADAGITLGACRWCGATDDRLPTLSQLRADALFAAVGLLSVSRRADGGDAAETEPRRGRRWRHAIVVCDLATALGLADSPGWIPGYGHIPAKLARELAVQASHWRRFLLDDRQQLVDAGRHTYRPTDRLRELVTARDQTCTFPGCARPASDADLDHRTNFDGGNTTAGNLHTLCRTHHRLKTHGGWRVSTTTTGWHTWTSPLGLKYTHRVVPPWLDP